MCMTDCEWGISNVSICESICSQQFKNKITMLYEIYNCFGHPFCLLVIHSILRSPFRASVNTTICQTVMHLNATQI